MTTFSQLVADVPNDSHTIASLLMRAKIIAYQLKSDELSQWLHAELGGYQDGSILPEYRVLHPLVQGDFYGPLGRRALHVTLAPAAIEDEELRDLVSTRRIGSNVGTIESMLTSQDEFFHTAFDGYVIGLLREEQIEQIEGFVLNAVYQVVNKSHIRGILQAIRYTLLTLLLELQKKFPALSSDEAAQQRVPAGSVDQITKQVVYNITVQGNATMSNFHVGGNLSAGGDVIVSDFINNSFNRVKESSAIRALSEALTALVQQVKDLSDKLEASQARQLAEDTDAFVKEAVKAAPRKNILIALAETVKSTAETAGKLGLPLLNAYNTTVGLLSQAGMI